MRNPNIPPDGSAIVYPSHLSGKLTVPPSKSAAHRALIGAALSDGPTLIRLGELNRDVEATMACLRALGAGFASKPSGRLVSPVSARPSHAVLPCDESASTLRFLMPVAAVLGIEARFTGRGRLPERPNAELILAMKRHGALIDNGSPPLTVRGRLSGGRWSLAGNVSSQYVSGLLFALPLLNEDSEILLTEPPESVFYIDMTLKTLRDFGVHVEAIPGGWRIPGGQRYHSPGEISIEGDWSAAAFWLAANALGADIRLEGLREDSLHGDRAMIRILGQPVIRAADIPDLVPALAVVAAALPQRTVITGAARLRFKESDRLTATADLINALGGRARETEDGLIIDGAVATPPSGDVSTVRGCRDHRIVMAAVIAAGCGRRPVRVTDIDAVQKSYPGFFRDFRMLGGQIHVEHTGEPLPGSDLRAEPFADDRRSD